MAVLGACTGTAPLDQHLLQEILDHQDRRAADSQGLRQHLGHPNATVRAWAARALGALDDTLAAAALAHTLEADPEPPVRREVAFALGLVEPGHPGLCAALRTDVDPAVRAVAAWAIGRAGAGARDLAAGLLDDAAQVREACATALALSGDAQAETHLVTACWDEADPAVRATILAALGLEPSPAAAAVLRSAALHAPTPATRSIVLAGLRGLRLLAQRDREGWWLSPRERHRLRSYLRLEDPALATAAAELLVALSAGNGGERAAEQQIADEQALLDAGTGVDSVLTGGWAAFPWSDGRRQAAAAALERAAVAPDPAVRAAALFAYTAVAPDSALRMLRQGLTARDARHRAMVVRALAALPAGGPGADLWARASADRSPLVRDALASAALWVHGRDPATPIGRLVRLAPAVAEALAVRIPELLAELRTEILARGLATVAHEDTTLRVALVRAIALLAEGESSSAAELHLLATDPDPAVRRTVQGLHGERGEPWPDARTFRLGIDLPWSAFARPPRLRVTTSAGRFDIELDAHAAPVHVHWLLARLRDGALASGVRRHDRSMAVLGNLSRLVPEPGDLLRRERAPTQLSQGGIVGFVPAAVPDCDGPDLFVTLAPRPDLLGSVTIVGRVRDGMEVVERLRAGDRILDITLVPDSD